MSLISDETDKVKLENIYNTYHDLIFKIAYKITEHQYYTETAMSNVLLILTKNIRKIRVENKDELKVFIITITKNEAANALKEKNKDLKNISHQSLKKQPRESVIERDLIIKESYSEALKAINNIPLEYGQVLILKYVNDLSVYEISKILNRKLSTIRVQLKRGRDILREILADSGLDV